MYSKKQILYNILYEEGVQFSVRAPDSGALAVQYPGKPLWLYVKENWEEEKLHHFLNKLDVSSSGLIAPSWVAKIYDERYRAATARRELAAFFLPNPVAMCKARGSLVFPSERDIPTISEWLVDFYNAALETEFVNSRETTAALIAGKKLHCLSVKGFGLVAMGMAIALPKGMSRLNLIYTSAKYRGQGFGKEVVTALSGLVQKENKVPVLYARVANKPAMQLYNSLGFIEAGRLIELKF